MATIPGSDVHMTFKRILYRVLLWRGVYFVSAFLLNVLFARFYGASASSAVYYLINLYTFVLLAGSLSLESGLSFFLARGEVTEGELYTFSLIWTTALSFLSIALLWLYFLFFDTDVITGNLFWVTALTYIPGQLLITFFTAFFYARESAVLPNRVLLAVNMLLIVLLLGAVLMPSLLDRRHYLHLYFTGTLAQGIALTILFRVKKVRKAGLTFPDRQLLKKIIRYSLVAFTANIIFFLVYRMDYWFVKRYCTAEELGNYIQVSKLGQMILIVPGILASLIFPRTALGNNDMMAVHLARMVRMAVALFLLLFIGLFLTGTWLFPFLFGHSFDKMYLPTLILLPGILFLSVLAPLSAYFAGLHRPGVNLRGALAGFLVMLVGDIFFIPRYGMEAAAAVSSVAYFACVIYSLVQFGRTHRLRLITLLIIKKEDWRWLLRQSGNIDL